MQFTATGETYADDPERGLEAYLAHLGVPARTLQDL